MELISRQVLELWNRYKPTIAVDAIEYDRELKKLLGTNLAEVGTDGISREQAIDAVRATLLAWSYMPEWRDNKIIDAIKQLPPIQPVNCSEFPNNSDVVDRQKAKNAICNACGKIDCDEMDTCEKLDIPSEGSKALEWQYHSYIPHNKYCPKCKKDSPYNKRWNFCPNCGAKMEVNHESN